jgi:hypothetical protein
MFGISPRNDIHVCMICFSNSGNFGARPNNRRARVADKYGRHTNADRTCWSRLVVPSLFACFHHLGNRKAAAVPRLKESLGLPAASQSTAATWASARSLTCA